MTAPPLHLQPSADAEDLAGPPGSPFERGDDHIVGRRALDSGRILAYVPSGESSRRGRGSLSHAGHGPDRSDSRLVITGAAKEFFAPDGPDTHIFFTETVTVILYYSKEDFTPDQRVGYDADGDLIPDRVEAALNVYYWDDLPRPGDPSRRRGPRPKPPDLRDAAFLPLWAAFTGRGLRRSVQDAVFPNPWRIDGIGTATAGLGAGNALRRQIGNLPTAQVQIRIYTMRGRR